MEAYVQVTLQILILLLARTETPTTGGLETIFNQKVLGIDPYTLLVLSISWSLFSCVWMHTSLIALEKGFCNVTTKLIIFVWGMFATLRRILSIIAMFIPSMGLFSILHHWRWEQIPFTARLEYAKRGFLTSDDKISLYGLHETIYWTELDRWDYSDDPAPPSYSIYTLFSLKITIIAGVLLFGLQFLVITVTKILTSAEFRERGNYVNKTIHVLENLNYATPFCDWDEGDHTTQEFRSRFKETCREMAATFSVNFLSTLTMLVPLWYTGQASYFV